MQKLKMQTPDLVDKNIEQIANLFPNVITETKDKDGNLKKVVDFDLLKQTLSNVLVEDDNERYRLDWPGKKASLLKANTPINKTLRPVIEDSLDFENTKNIYVEGDNFEVLKILQESYLGKIKLIYIDPPYNTGNDFIYKDNYMVSKEEYDEEIGVENEEGEKLFRNIDSNGRFHSDWLCMMYERLAVARDLISDDGIIFISIGEEEVDNTIKLCNEIFGESNQLGIVSRVAKTASNKGTYFAPSVDYCIVYGKNSDFISPFVGEVDESLYKKVEENGERVGDKYRDDIALYQSSLDPMRGCKNQRYYIKAPDGSLLIPKGDNYPSKKKDASFIEPQNHKDKVWRWSYETYLKNKDLLVFKETTSSPLVDEKEKQAKYNIYTKSYLKDRQVTGTLPRNLWLNFINRKGADLLKKMEIPFGFSKPVELIKYILEISKSKECLVLDFFSGSATTAHAVMQLNAEDGGNRKFIMVQLPEKTDEESEAYKAGYKTISEIGQERIRRAGKKIIEELKGKNEQLELGEESIDINKLDIGFRVYKTDSSNMKDVFYHPSELKQEQLSILESNIKEDRTPEDILTQVILDLGLELSLPMQKKEILGNTVFIVQQNALVACFDDDINFKIVDEIAELKPFKVVFKDASFKDDKDRINVEERFKRLSPETVVTVI